MADISLEVSPREVFGRKVKRLRAQGQIPAIIYGHGIEPVSVQVERRALEQAHRQGGTTSLIDLKMAGRDKPFTTFIQTIHRDDFRREWIHVEFHAVNLQEEMTTHVPILLVNDAPAVDKGMGILIHGLTEIEVRSLPTDLPHNIIVDLSELTEVDQAIHVRDLTLPVSVKILTDEDEMLVKIGDLSAAEVEKVEEEAEGPAEAPARSEGES
jgi:large subunit ribosomal protein L25